MARPEPPISQAAITGMAMGAGPYGPVTNRLIEACAISTSQPYACVLLAALNIQSTVYFRSSAS